MQDRAKSEIYSVSQVNRYINYMFTQDFLLRFLTVRGEVSNCTDHPSGHLYFTLKDATGILSCVMFASKRSGLSFRMQSGMQVLVSGAVGVYKRGGKYQLLAEEIRQDGSGSIYERFEKLKKELEERGMFDPSYKQPIPKYIRKLGVVTAPGGAALRDIIQITLRRNPYIQIILYPALVQGEKAAQSIAEGIVCLSQTDVDVMIVGRGGGSIEELSAFNEEVVAQAIFDCETPVISAVGHETDFTIADFVADLRAPTPSAAAELAVFEYDHFVETLISYRDSLTAGIWNKIRQDKNHLLLLQKHLQMLHPAMKIREQRMRAAELERILAEHMNRTLQERRGRLLGLEEVLSAHSPAKRLRGSFGFITDETGRPVADPHHLRLGEMIQIRMERGKICAKIEEIGE